MDIADFRTAVADALRPITIRVYPYMTIAPDPPAALIYPDSIPPQESMGGLRRPVFVVRLLAPNGTTESATQTVDVWISTGNDQSVLDALEAMTAYNLSSPSVRNYGPLLGADGGTVFMSAELVFDIF